jgi:DNA-binding response OmpR family regulator
LLKKSGEHTPLTAGEFELLRVLVQNTQRVLSRETLMDLTKGQEWAPFDRAIDTQIGRLRKKLESQGDAPEIIKTVRGVGYVFAATVTLE